MRVTFFLFISFISQSFAQDYSQAVFWLDGQSTVSSPISQPFQLGLVPQIGFKRSTFIYSAPVKSDSFKLLPLEKLENWIEVKRQRYEYGLGLGALPTPGFSVGLIPFKGARKFTVKKKSADKNELSEDDDLPADFAEFKNWSVGDFGSYERFGGIQAALGAGVGYVNVLSAMYVVQNVWNVTVRKISHSKVVLTLNEDQIRKRDFASGTLIANSNLSYYRGSRLMSEFVLDLRESHDYELYSKALSGNISELQFYLPKRRQNIQWIGKEHSGYIGVPWIMGRQYGRSHFEFDHRGEEAQLDIRSRENTGIILPDRYHYRMVFQVKDMISLFWYSEADKAHAKVFNKRFVTPAFSMGLTGLDSLSWVQGPAGPIQTQIGISFHKKHFLQLRDKAREEFAELFVQRCFDLKLSCARRPNRILKKLERALKDEEEIGKEVGLLLLKEPALIYALVNFLRVEKYAVFRFLSENYQSMEGKVLIGP